MRQPFTPGRNRVGGAAMHGLKLFISAAALAGGVLASGTLAAHAAPITPEEAAKHVGEDVTVCGTVAGAKHAGQARGAPTFIDFGQPYPNSIFTALILGSDRAKFGTPEKDLQGKQVCVTGKIRLYEGKPEIILTDPKQLSGK
jgi:hypothetical protein